MSAFLQFTRRLRALFRKDKIDRDMAEEMRFHLDERAAHEAANGLSAEEARHAAQRRFGGLEQTKERCREQRGIPSIEQTWRDLRLATRSLAKAPGFALTAVGTLALGIGLVTIQFSFINGALFRGLPFEGSE